MKEKFTPAPWDWSHDNETACTISIFGLYGVEICRLQSEPDAHLIAAAPEMYAALEHIMNNQALGSPLSLSINNLLAKARGE